MSEETTVVFQEGDRVKYEHEGEIDYGTVVEVGGSIYTYYGDIWAMWDSNDCKQNAAKSSLTLISRKEQSKPAQKHYPHRLKYCAHKYADVIKHWADGGEIQYQYQGSTKWVTYKLPKNLPFVNSFEHNWRIKPEVKSISYRVGITKDNQVKVYHEEPTLDDAYGSDAFKDWLDPEWRTVEVEV